MPCGFDADTLRQIVRIGLPLGLNSALYSIGHVFLQVLYNLQGSVFVAGCSVAGKVGGLANITVTSLSQATSVFAGQNLGAQSYSRLRRGGWLLPAASGLLSLAGGLLMAACCRPLLLQKYRLLHPSVLQWFPGCCCSVNRRSRLWSAP